MNLKQKLFSKRGLAISGAAVLLLGGGIAAAAVSNCEDRTEAMAPAAPVAIASLAQASQPLVTVRGRIAQMFGSHFVLNDGSGQLLVDTGHGRGSGDTALALGQVVTAQGRYEDGVLRARYLVGPDGRVAALGGRGGGRHGRGDHEGRRGGGEASAPPAAQAPAPAPAQNAAAPAQ
jgi:hypothetical protein